MCETGAAVEPPSVAAPPPVSAVTGLPPEPAHAPGTESSVVAALTIFEGQAVFRILSPGSATFRAGDVLRFAYGSRSTKGRRS